MAPTPVATPPLAIFTVPLLDMQATLPCTFWSWPSMSTLVFDALVDATWPLLEQPASAAARMAAPARVIMAPRFTSEWLVFTVCFLSVVPGAQPSQRGRPRQLLRCLCVLRYFPARSQCAAGPNGSLMDVGGSFTALTEASGPWRAPHCRCALQMA